MSDHPKVRSFFFNFILNYANSQLKFKIQASRFWRITSSFSRLQLKYWPKFDQLTHCYTLFTVPHVGDTGKNEGKQEEVEVTPVSIAHDVRKWLSDNAVSVAVFAKEVINLSQGTLSSLLNEPPEAFPSGAGREPWQKMKTFLTSPQERQKLSDIKIMKDNIIFFTEFSLHLK